MKIDATTKGIVYNRPLRGFWRGLGRGLSHDLATANVFAWREVMRDVLGNPALSFWPVRG